MNGWSGKRVGLTISAVVAVLALAAVAWLLTRPDPDELEEIVTVDAAGDTLVYSGPVRDAIARAQIVEAFNSVAVRPADSAEAAPEADSLKRAAAEVRTARQAAIDALARLYSGSVDAEAAVTALNLAIIDFKPGSATLPPDAAGFVQAAAEVIQRAPEGTVFVITAYATDQADPAENLALSEERAEAVADALEDAGVDGDRLRAEGYGSARAIGPEGDTSDRLIVFSSEEPEPEAEEAEESAEGEEADTSGEGEELLEPEEADTSEAAEEPAYSPDSGDRADSEAPPESASGAPSPDSEDPSASDSSSDAGPTSD